MNEMLQITLMACFGACFAIGGTGFLEVRRYLMPGLGAVIITWAVPDAWFLTLAAMILLGIVLHFGYGDEVNWPWKALVGFSYSLPSLFYGWSWWNFIYPGLFIGLFALSNWKPSAKSFTWKICEFIFGSGIAFTLIGAIQNRW